MRILPWLPGILLLAPSCSTPGFARLPAPVGVESVWIQALGLE